MVKRVPVADRLKRDSERAKEAEYTEPSPAEKIIESSPKLENDINNANNISNNNNINIDNNNNINNNIDINNNTNNDIENNTNINTNNDNNSNTNINNNIVTKKNIKIVIKKDIKKDIKKKPIKKGYHCHIYSEYIEALDVLKEATNKYKDDLAQEAFELLFKKYGVDIQLIDEE